MKKQVEYDTDDELLVCREDLEAVLICLDGCPLTGYAQKAKNIINELLEEESE